MTGGPAVRVERPEPGVGLLVLDRPDQLNVFSSAMTEALADGVAELEDDGAIGAIVVAGEGRAFCAGADITELDTLEGPHAFSTFVGRLTAVFGALGSCPKPSVAALHGVALGAGCELALACDLRVADEKARLGVPEIKLGLLPGAAGTARLAKMLPSAIVKQMLMTGEPLDATAAHRIGLVNEVVAAGEGVEAAVALGARLASMPPLALAAAKRLVDRGALLPLDAAITLERETVSMLFATEDRVEGVGAFLAKRAPTFRGR